MLLIAAASFGASSVFAEPKPVDVACNLPLTGPHAIYGNNIREGITFAQEQMAPGLAAGVRYHWDDNRSDPKETVSVLRRQLLTNPAIYLSGVKPEYMAIHDLLAPKPMPHFVWIYDNYVRGKGERNFRTWVSFRAELPLILDYAKSVKPKKIAILYPQLPHTDEHYLENVIPGLKAAGFSEPLVRAYPLDKTDFRDEALRVQQFATDLIILCGFQENYLGMVRALNNFKLIHDGNTLASYDMADAAPLFKPEEIEGIRGTAPLFDLDKDSSKNRAWAEKYKARFGVEPSFTNAYAADMATIVADAIHRAEGSSDPDALFRALEATDLPGVTGPLRFDGRGDLVPQVGIGVYRNGKLVRESSREKQWIYPN